MQYNYNHYKFAIKLSLYYTNDIIMLFLSVLWTFSYKESAQSFVRGLREGSVIIEIIKLVKAI